MLELGGGSRQTPTVKSRNAATNVRAFHADTSPKDFTSPGTA
jgi:hypothetical protein